MQQPLIAPQQSSWTPKVVAGVAAVAAVATLAVAQTSTSSLYAAPVVAPSATVAAQPIYQPMARPAVARAGVAAAAAPVNYEPEATYEMEQIYTAQPSSVNWTPLAALAAIPMGVVAAMAAMKKKAAPLAPLDMNVVGGEWAMMAAAGDGGEVARNYAQALVELGQETKSLDQLHTDLENFGSIISDASFGGFFTNPIISDSKTREMIEKICDDINASPVTKNFLYFLQDKKRIKFLEQIIVAFDGIYYDVTGTQVATVTAATPLTEEQLRMIANKLHTMTKGKNIKIKSQVNSSLLAGFTLEYGKTGSQRVDLSLRGQLEGLEAGLKESVRKLIAGGVPAAMQFMIAAVGVNAIMAGDADAAGKLFDFDATMPIQMVQFLLLMVFTEKTIFTPVGKILDTRSSELKAKTTLGASNSTEIAKMAEEAQALLDAAKKDASAAMDKAKKEASTAGNAKLAAEKAKVDAATKMGVDEIAKAKEALWAKLESDVVPKLADDILLKVIPKEAAVSK